MTTSSASIGGQEGTEGQGVAAPSEPPLSHASGAKPVPVLGKAGIANVGHTPGPWLMAAKPSSVVGWPVVAPQALGRVVCSLNYADPKAFGGRQTGDTKFNRESRANGLLIAAAPTLAEALNSAWAVLSIILDAGFVPTEHSAPVEQCRDNARAALALSRGEA